MDAPKPAFKEKVFSGVQPTGNLHLGNYLGAIVKFVELQKTHDCIYCVVDLHAITVWQEPEELTKAIREVTAAFIACGCRSLAYQQVIPIERSANVISMPPCTTPRRL